MLQDAQRRLLAGFFSNMSVAWFVAAFIGATNLVSSVQYGLSGGLSLALALTLSNEVHEK